MKRVLAVLFLLISSPSYADQYAAIFRFNNWVSAKADTEIRKQMHTALNDIDLDLLRDRAMEVNVWRHSQDVIGTDVEGNQTRIHNYFNGATFIISLPFLIRELRDHPALQVVLNLNKCEAKIVGCVVKSNISNVILQDLRFSPVFAGMNLPWGDFK